MGCIVRDIWKLSVKAGDIILLRSQLFFSRNQNIDEYAIVIEAPYIRGTKSTGKFLIMFDDGDIQDYTGYEDQFEIILRDESYTP
jgi:hypothetical protein